jgi:hypothetical protein
MKRRWISVVLCLLYLGISSVFAAVHHHDNDRSQSDLDCAACAWHYHAQVDVPVVRYAFTRVELFIGYSKESLFFIAEHSLWIHPNRGPPSLL